MKKVVIHTMVGKEDGERRRWKGKPGIKESLRAGSSVLTLSCSVDITDNSRRRPRQHRPTRGSFLFFFFDDEKETRGESQEDLALGPRLPYFWFLLFDPPLRGRLWRFAVVVDVTQFQPYSRPDSIMSVDISTYYNKVPSIDFLVRIIILSDAVCDDSGMAFVVCCLCVS